MKKLNIALVGSPQSGKSELGPDINEMEGVSFVDVYLRSCALRQAGSPTRSFYDEILSSGSLKEDGSSRAPYYLQMAQNRELIGKILDFEKPQITEWLQKEMIQRSGNENLVLSWAYWPEILDEIKPDHVVHLDCTNRDAWYDKLQKRVAARFSGASFENSQFDAMMQGLQCDPDGLLERVRSKVSPEKLTIIDTSADDWNKSEVISTIRNLIMAH